MEKPLSKLLPIRIYNEIAAVCSEDKLTEIRLRKDKPLSYACEGIYRILPDDITVSTDDIAYVLACATKSSLYAYDSSILQGYVTYEGGIRIGLSGEGVTKGDTLTAIKNINSLCIRIPHYVEIRDRRIDALIENFDNTLIVSRPGMGKTSLLLHFAKSIAFEGGTVAIFSLEMNDVSLTNRMILSIEDIDGAAFKDGRLTEAERSRMLDAMGVLRRLPIHIDETPHLSVQQIKVRAMNLKRKSGLGVVMIDYLQLMNMRSDNRQYNREQEIAQTTRRLKQMAKDLEVPVVLLSQLNRNIDQKLKDGKMTTSMPQLSDLRESGAIEQDADVVLLIHRPEYYNDTDAIPGVGLINIAKQREGKTGKVKFSYNESLTRIGDVEDDLQKPF